MAHQNTDGCLAGEIWRFCFLLSTFLYFNIFLQLVCITFVIRQKNVFKQKGKSSYILPD